MNSTTAHAELISSDLCFTEYGNVFVMYDSLYDKNHYRFDGRILLLSTQNNLDMLRVRKRWLGFGVQLVEKIGYLFTISVVSMMRTVPAVYMIIPNSNNVTFQLMYRIFKRFLRQPDYPDFFIFAAEELDALSTFKEEFPQVNIFPSNVHLKNMLNDMYVNENLYKTLGLEGQEALQHLVNLSYAPEDDVVNNYEQLKASVYFRTHADMLKVIIDYFEKMYVGERTGPNGIMRTRPYCPKEVWHHGPTYRAENEDRNSFINEWYEVFIDMLNEKGRPDSINELVLRLQKHNRYVEDEVSEILAKTNRPGEEMEDDE